jgi:DNA polymerase-3 subunit gamma/tau
VFENLLFQDRAKEQLTSMIAGEKVPPALLFTGPEGSGKLTAALECARVLSCEKEGLWNCECGQCNRHRSLSHPDLLLFGPRNLPQEPSVTAEYFMHSPNLTSYYAFVRSIRKLLKHFDPVLWAGEEARLSKAIASIESLEEQLQEIQTLVSRSKIQTLDTIVNRVVETASSLEAFVPDGIPIFMVRNMAAWAVIAPVGKRKTVILQNADTANESTRNAMLKILEEPPETVRFILTSSRRAAVIATILSRSRLISFEPRTSAQAQHIVSRLFRSQEKVENISEFFHKNSPFPPDKAEDEASLFVGALLDRAMGKDAAMTGDRASNLARRARDQKGSALEVLRAVAEQTGSFGSKNTKFSNSFFVFMRAVAQQLASIAADPTSSVALIMYVDRLTSKLREMGVQYRSFNRSPELLLEAFVDMFGEYHESSV